MASAGSRLDSITDPSSPIVIKPESKSASMFGDSSSPLNTSSRSSSLSQLAQGLMCDARSS